MRIKKWINIEQEVDIDLTSEDICGIYTLDPESVDSILRAVNDVVCFLRGIPSGKIAEMSDSTRTLISEFFLEQSKRYRV